MASIPGFSADGIFIENPSLFLQSIVSIPKSINPPKFEKNTRASLLIDTRVNSKLVESTNIPGLSRISSSAENNCCWFDSFLQCMIPAYRSLSIETRIPIFKAFRAWCAKDENIKKILNEAPSFMNKSGLSDVLIQFKGNVQNLTSEIDWLSGFLIAWYFGVNLIYVNQPYKGLYALVCETAYQSPNCSSIIMNLSESSASSAKHYEPIGIISLNNQSMLDELKSRFIFNWKEENTPGSDALCYLKLFKELVCDKSGFKIHDSWKYPKNCPKAILEYSTKEVEKYKAKLVGSSTSANISKANYGEKVSGLLAKIEDGDETALNELIKMGKKELVDKISDVALGYLRGYKYRIEEKAKTNTNAKNVLEYLNTVPKSGGRRYRKTRSKTKKIKSKTRSRK
jgi:hypothetical protein